MKLDIDEALFSVKCFIAAFLAFYVALKIGLTRPYWAVTTSYIVAQPLAGAVLSKAAFRLIGTGFGAIGAVVLVPAFVNEPYVLSFALALWLGGCLYVSLLDRTPRAYVFLLAGYTACIIGFPSVEAPGTIFNTAILRVQEIGIGIVCGSLVHGLVFPRTVTALLLQRIDAIITAGEKWSREALARSERAVSREEQHRIAIDLTELDQLSVHLPFDTARLLPRVRSVRALQNRLLEILPMGSTVEDRLNALDARGGIPPETAAVVADVRDWLATGVREPDRDGTAALLIERIEAIPVTEDSVRWGDLLALNLRSRLAQLVEVHRDVRDLRDQINSPGLRPINARVATLLSQTPGRELHRDHGLALRATLGTVACLMLGCVFWITTAWPDGAGAVLIAGVCCALFANVDRPGPIIVLFLIGSAIGLAIAAVYAYAILPAVTSFEMFIAVTAPVMLLAGSVMARPRWTLIALGALMGFLNTVGFNATYDGNFPAFINGGIAQLIGTAFAVVMVSLFQTIGTRHSIARLFRAGWRDVAWRAAGRSTNEIRWASRMLDRVGLLIPRLAASEEERPENLIDALVDMRIGIVSGRLREIDRGAAPEQRAMVDEALDAIARHYRGLDPLHPVPPPDDLLATIDRTIASFDTEPDRTRRREGLILLTSLRRNMFPRAQDYGAAA